MKQSENKVSEFFNGLVARHGYSHKALAYGSESTRERKYSALVGIFDVYGIPRDTELSILDVGCGFGDLAQFMSERGIRFRYTGIDISSGMVATARQEKPHLDIREEDVLDLKGEGLYDYVLCTGFNCVPTGCNWSTMTKALTVMYGLARVGVAFGAVSDYREKKDSETYYANPEKIFSWCMKNITLRTILRHDYLPHDFTLYLFKDHPTTFPYS